MEIKFKYVGAKGSEYTPQHATKGASGCDLRNASGKDITIPPQSKEGIPTGICVEIPKGFEGQLRPRSGLATKKYLIQLPSVGTIDSDYRGEIRSIYFNPTDRFVVIKKDERVSQLVVAPYKECEYKNQEELEDTERGANGFGSSGTI